MTIETATYLKDLNNALPATGDLVAEGDEHLRLMKTVLQTTFPGRGVADMGVVAKATGFSASVTEIGCVYKCTAALTLEPPGASGLVAGTHWFIRAAGGAVLIDPPDAALINGAATLTLPTDAAAILVFDGTDWVAFVMGSLVAGTGPAFSAYAAAGTSIPNAVETKVTFGTEEFDTNGSYDTALSRWTPGVAGYYQIEATVWFAAPAMADLQVFIRKNGGNIAVGVFGTLRAANVTRTLYLSATDYVEIFAYQASGGARTSGSGYLSHFGGTLVRAG